jgi:hypothetical protein
VKYFALPKNSFLSLIHPSNFTCFEINLNDFLILTHPLVNSCFRPCHDVMPITAIMSQNVPSCYETAIIADALT